MLEVLKGSKVGMKHLNFDQSIDFVTVYIIYCILVKSTPEGNLPWNKYTFGS